jgi:hypothetical protein
MNGVKLVMKLHEGGVYLRASKTDGGDGRNKGFAIAGVRSNKTREYHR